MSEKQPCPCCGKPYVPVKHGTAYKILIDGTLHKAVAAIIREDGVVWEGYTYHSVAEEWRSNYQRTRLSHNVKLKTIVSKIFNTTDYEEL